MQNLLKKMIENGNLQTFKEMIWWVKLQNLQKLIWNDNLQNLLKVIWFGNFNFLNQPSLSQFANFATKDDLLRSEVFTVVYKKFYLNT